MQTPKSSSEIPAPAALRLAMFARYVKEEKRKNEKSPTVLLLFLLAGGVVGGGLGLNPSGDGPFGRRWEIRRRRSRERKQRQVQPLHRKGSGGVGWGGNDVSAVLERWRAVSCTRRENDMSKTVQIKQPGPGIDERICQFDLGVVKSYHVGGWDTPSNYDDSTVEMQSQQMWDQ
ncbi:hypothetical protein ACLOJK_005446 [Asimina triloba]